MKIAHNNKGYTLIEAIIVIAIIVLILAVVFNIFFVSRDTFETGVSKSIIQQDIRISSSAIIDELKFAKEVSASPISGEKYYKLVLQPSAETSYNSLSIESYDDSGNLLTQRELGDYIQSLSFKTTTTDSNLVRFTVIANSGEDNMEVNSSVILNNTTTDLTTATSVVYYSKYD